MIRETEMQRVVDTIRAAEARTSGEIFCVIAHASSSYRLVPIAWASMVALVVPLVLIYLTKWPAGTIYMLQLAAFIVIAGDFVVARGAVPDCTKADDAPARAC